MVAPYFLLLAAVTLRQDAPLRSGCETDDHVIGQAKAGMAAEIRFALAASACYKISTEAGTGYVRASDLDGLETFEAERSRALLTRETARAARQEMRNIPKAVSVTLTPNGPLAAAMKLLDANQPAAALASLDPMLKRPHKDPALLFVAGFAALRNDDTRQALDYWRESLELRPDPNLRRIYDNLLRETQADRSTQKAVGMRVNLRYEADTVTPAQAQEMLNALDSEYARISDQLGCRAEERITAIVQSRAAYLRTTGAEEWSGGQYDGRIRVSLVDENGVGPKTRRSFAHELVHACLASMGQWPAWFHEGMAQKLAGDRLSARDQQMLDTLARAHQLPSLNALSPTMAGSNTQAVVIAYSLSLRAADRIMEKYSAYGIRNILNNPAKFREITQTLDHEFGSAP